MANQYSKVFAQAVEQLRSEYDAEGKANDAVLWLNMHYIKDDGEVIEVGVPSAFMWRMMNDKGVVAQITQKISSLAGKDVRLSSVVTDGEGSEGSADTPPLQAHIGDAYMRQSQTPINANRSHLLTPIGEAYNSISQTPINANRSGLLTPIGGAGASAQSGGGFSSAVSAPPHQISRHPQLRSEFTFDTFVPGENSEYAYNVCLAAAKEPGRKFNPILLYGGVGLGKTHLMQAIGNYIYKERGGNVKIVCVSAETFGNDFTSALKPPRTIDKFKAKYRNCDVLLLDDIHFLQGKKPAMQDELFYTFNALRDKDKQMVFTCDRPISQLSTVVDRLQSRLSNGQCVDLRAPNYDTRRAILRKKIDAKGFLVDNSVVDYIAAEIKTNVRDLESALNKICGYAEMTKKTVDVELARYLIKDMKAPPKHILTIEAIQKAVAEEFNVTVQELRGKKRDKRLSYPRQVACYISRELTEAAFSDIGHEFGDRDHATIMHACDVIGTDRKLDPEVDDRITKIIEGIKG